MVTILGQIEVAGDERGEESGQLASDDSKKWRAEDGNAFKEVDMPLEGGMSKGKLNCSGGLKQDFVRRWNCSKLGSIC
jgi:hypothetical protein